MALNSTFAAGTRLNATTSGAFGSSTHQLPAPKATSLPRRFSLKEFVPRLDTTMEVSARRESPALMQASMLRPRPSFSTTSRTGRSLFNDSRVQLMDTSAMRFQEADDYTKSAVSGIIDRIKHRPEASERAAIQEEEEQQQRQEREQQQKEKLDQYTRQIEETQNQLQSLEAKLGTIDIAQQHQQNGAKDSSSKLVSYAKRKEKQQQQLREMIQDQRMTEKQLERILVDEEKELEQLETEARELSKDLERAEKLKLYLQGRKSELWALKHYHQRDRGVLASQNHKIDQLHLENRSLRLKELWRLQNGEMSEDIELAQNSHKMTDDIQKYEKMNKKLRRKLEEITKNPPA